MTPYLFDRTYDTGINEHQAYHVLIERLKHRFQTYGYHQVRTSTFEQYDLYHSIKGSVDRDNMVKVIDQSGKVLVMRPDVTIPITRMTALSNQTESRLFYMLNVFRQNQDSDGLKERLQAGIERFGSDRPETDAEVITLAIHALQDLGFSHFKIEIGHAGFFKEILQQLNVARNEKEQLKTLIESKNLADIEPFLAHLNVSHDVTRIIQTIPLLYGDPQNVLERVRTLPLTAEMQQKIADLKTLYTLLQAYEVTDQVVLDLGLINHMDYYTDVIFQGFIAGYGKPVVMGGRYNHLGNQFGTPLPAIGFAYEVNDLLDALKQEEQLTKQAPYVDLALFYHESQQSRAFKLANRLRNAGYAVVIYPHDQDKSTVDKSRSTVEINQTDQQFHYNQTSQHFADTPQLLNLLSNTIGGE